MRLASTPTAPPVNTKSQVAFGPDTIAAVAHALELCLEDLPERGVSSTARDILQKALLEAAGRGERDANKLTAFALEKLRTRA